MVLEYGRWPGNEVIPLKSTERSVKKGDLDCKAGKIGYEKQVPSQAEENQCCVLEANIVFEEERDQLLDATDRQPN